MTGEIKQLDPAALGTLLCGIVLTDNFGMAAEAAEWVAGHPVWTHQYVHKPTMDRIKAEILRQFPDMPADKPADYAARRDDLRARYGATVAVERGTGEPPEILAGIPDDQRHKVVIVDP